MKYPEEKYTQSSYFGPDMDSEIEHQHIKLVKTRKDHKCCGYGKNCQHIIPKGEHAVVETAILTHEGGWKSCYLCIPCIEEWLEESHQVAITHDLKILRQYFEPVRDGEKRFELRKNDRGYKVGDSLRLRKWEDGEFTGRETTVTIRYILQDCPEYGLADGFCILGF
jgi:hypothetical protein